MLHRKVKHEVGLAAVMGALVVSWFGAGLPALNASVVAAPVEDYTSLPVAGENADYDRDGVPDYIDATPLGK